MTIPAPTLPEAVEVASVALQAGGGFDLSRAMPLYSGGQMMDQQGSEGGSSFDAMMATKVGRGITTSKLRS